MKYYIISLFLLHSFGCCNNYKIEKIDPDYATIIDTIEYKPIITQRGCINPIDKTLISVKCFEPIIDNNSISNAKMIGGFDQILLKLFYPELAKRSKIFGSVEAGFDINTKGKTENIVITKSIGGNCEDVVLEAIKDLQFVPAMKGQTAVVQRYLLCIYFDIQNKYD